MRDLILSADVTLDGFMVPGDELDRKMMTEEVNPRRSN